jgi:hypothetical protein
MTASSGLMRKSRQYTSRAIEIPIGHPATQQTPGPARDGSDLCWYHASWGKKAKKCRPGCSWQAEN